MIVMIGYVKIWATVLFYLVKLEAGENTWHILIDSFQKSTFKKATEKINHLDRFWIQLDRAVTTNPPTLKIVLLV